MFENPVTDAVKALEATWHTLSPEAVTAMSTECDLNPTEWFAVGDWSTRGHMAGVISLDSANALHNIHTRWDSASTAERYVFLRCMTLIGPRIMTA